MVIGVFTDGQVSGDLLPSLVFVFPGLDPSFFGAVYYFLFWELGPVSPDTLFGGRTRPFVRRSLVCSALRASVTCV